MIKTLLDFAIELILVCIGIYYIINYKSASESALARSRSVFGKPKYLSIVGPYFFLFIGVILVIFGVLTFLHIVKLR